MGLVVLSGGVPTPAGHQCSPCESVKLNIMGIWKGEFIPYDGGAFMAYTVGPVVIVRI